MTGDRSARARATIAVLVGLLAATMLLSLASGASDASAGAVILHWLLPPASDAALSARDAIIIYDIRMPRVVLGALIGAALAVSGAVMQGLFRNPLADPGLVGVSAGAGLGAVSMIVLGGTALAPVSALLGIYALPAAAFLGGLAVTLVLYRISTRRGQTSVATMLLAGIALAALAGAAMGLLIFMADDRQLRDLTFWNLGSLAGATWIKIAGVGPVIALALATAPFLARGLNALALGETTAHHLGIPVQRFKYVAIVAVAQAPSHRGQVAAMAFVGVLLVTLFAPRRSGAERRAATTAQARFAPLEGVLAADLATAVPDPLIVFDQRGTIVHVNPAAAVAFGAVAAGVSLHLKFRTPEMHALIEGVVADPASVHPVDYLERVPVERVFRVFASAIGRGSGLYALVFRDQSETRRIDRMRADFIANASHELRTPLASIGGFVETLRGPARNDAAARDHFLQIMQEQTQRMARLIDDLLSLSRLEMKPYSRTGPAVDLVRIVEAVVASLAPLATESGVVIERDLPAVPVEVAGDRDELFQVFENLLENAI